MSSTPRIALALGGGSARGLAHVLMLEAFDELGIKPAVIAGTSMGAICGACYAAGLSAPRSARSFRPVRAAARLPEALRRQAARRAVHAVEPARAAAHRQRDAVRDAAAGRPALRLRRAQDPVPGGRRRFLRHRAGGARPRPADPGAGGQLRRCPSMARPVVIEGRVLIDGGYVNPVPYDVVMATRRHHRRRRRDGRHAAPPRRQRAAAPSTR